jgi:ribokinase
LSPGDIERAESVIAVADVVVTQLETPLDVLACVAKLAKKHGVPLILDPAPAPDHALPVEILRDVTCIKPNENETERLTGIKVSDLASAQHAGDLLLGLGVKAAIITLGSDGSLLVESPGKGVHVPGYKVEAIDTTAAGDAFSGALACGIGEGRTLHEAVKIATAVAALSVTRLGAQPSLPSKAEVEAFMK